jgi:hypothetical protein
MLSKIDNHAELAIGRVAEEYKQSTGLLGIIEAWADQTQEADDAIWQLATERYLYSDADIGDVTVNYEATGRQLDVLGRLLGESRGSMTDAQYRLLLKAKVRLIKSSGTTENLLSIFHALLPDATPECVTRPPSYVSVRIDDPITADEAYIGSRLLREGRGGGVYGSFRWQQSETALLFKFDSGPGFDQGVLAGSKRS